jgi:site-specific recombinase XerD
MSERSGRKSKSERQTLLIGEWPEADRRAWEDACRPSVRLKKGGSGSHLDPESQDDYAQRLGRYLGFLKRTGRLHLSAPAAGQVTPQNVELYMADFEGKISSVTAWNCIYKLRRAAQLLSPKTDFTWLIEIERDLELFQEPRSKLNRFVYTEHIVKAGLTLVVEAKELTDAAFKRARGIRNGLMLALLALNPMRRKNFAALEIGTTFKQIEGRWWICLPAKSTKSRRRPEERPVATWLNPYIELYLKEARPVLLTGARKDTKALWISSSTRSPMTAQKVGSLITQVTQETLGIAISPHLFRTADATTAADASGEMPHLSSALLGHTDSRITDQHYKRNSSINAQNDYAQMVQRKYLSPS